jgi:hypothetical protein
LRRFGQIIRQANHFGKLAISVKHLPAKSHDWLRYPEARRFPGTDRLMPGQGDDKMDEVYSALRTRAIMVIVCAFSCGIATSAFAVAPFVFA